jgi:hypothetical protein
MSENNESFFDVYGQDGSNEQKELGDNKLGGDSQNGMNGSQVESSTGDAMVDDNVPKKKMLFQICSNLKHFQM